MYNEHDHIYTLSIINMSIQWLILALLVSFVSANGLRGHSGHTEKIWLERSTTVLIAQDSDCQTVVISGRYGQKTLAPSESFLLMVDDCYSIKCIDRQKVSYQIIRPKNVKPRLLDEDFKQVAGTVKST